MARSVVEQLIRQGRVRRGQLGVVVQAVTADIAASIGMREARGVIVSAVQPGSAAARAGVERGDVITALNGQEVNEPNVLRNLVAAATPGTEVTLTVVRGGQERQVQAALGELSGGGASPERGQRGDGGGDDGGAGGRLGITAEPLSPELAARLGLPEGAEGLVVLNVEEGGPAASAGLRQGDLIEQANSRPVRTVEELRAAVADAADRPLLLLVNRPRAGTIFVTVRPRR
jgi:serine protease Do